MSAKKLISDYFANLERIVALDEQLADANVAAKEAMVQIKKIYKDRPREVVLVGRGKSRRGIVVGYDEDDRFTMDELPVGSD